MNSITKLDHLEYLWNGELLDREKVLVLGSEIGADGRNFKPLWGPGIYFLWDSDGLQYIGQSESIWRRFCQHHIIPNPKDMRKWIIGIVPITDRDERLYLETYCIHTFRPSKNRR
jgi:hypothetical protein